MFLLCLVIILTATIFSLANSESINRLEMQGIYNNSQIVLPNDDKIFHRGQDNRIHIDFYAVKEKLVNIQLKKDGKLILQDTVYDLSRNVIYELNLEKYGKGEYTIALTTSLERKITETFLVQ